jgi:serine O-acetyltransferase
LQSHYRNAQQEIIFHHAVRAIRQKPSDNFSMTNSRNATIDALQSLRGGLSDKFPDPAAVSQFADTSLATLFPHHSGGKQIERSTLDALITTIEADLTKLCTPVCAEGREVSALVEGFIQHLPEFHSILLEDAQAIYNGDPAAKSVDEVILAYPGFLAIAVYRIAHWLHRQKVSIVPRMLSEYAHRLTGIEIHPGASIGRSFVIDHGTGIVIGETTVIHDNVKLYQGVTLGALSVDKSMADTRRHPTIERDVVIYANATILGGKTVIGAGSIVGGNVWITESVAPGSRVYHNR